jgi:lipopolysaccharide/colanic/teichoic acid biosynthesis glycosyltransferase/energy-coupling factor transporter ATP-binding protein EcfA2
LSDSAGPSSRVAKAIAAGLVAVGVPTGAITALHPLQSRPLLFVVLTAVYWFLLLVSGFVVSVLHDLRGKLITRTSGAVDQMLQRWTSRYTKHYLRYVVADNRYVDLKGVTTQGDFALQAEDIYVDLAVTNDGKHGFAADPVQIDARPDVAVASIWHWVRHGATSRATAIVGPPGSGKTTLLRNLAHVVAARGPRARRLNAPRMIPVVLYLRDHKDWGTQTPGNLFELIAHALPELHGHKPPSTWVVNHLRRGRFLVLLDGLDEVPDPDVRRRIAEWVERQISQQDGNIFVVTSRPFGYQENQIAGTQVLHVRPFTDKQIETFVKRWYDATLTRSYGERNSTFRKARDEGIDDLLSQLHRSPSLHALAANPLLLTMIVNVHNYRGALPGTRAEPVPATKKQVVLQRLAFQMMVSGVRDISTADVTADIGGVLSSVAPTMEVKEFLRDLQDSSGLVLERERDSFSFVHLTLQEYLAAQYVRENGLGDLLASKVTDSWWRETILLYVANANADPIVEACLTASVDRTEQLVLAQQCADQGRELSAELRARLIKEFNPPSLRDDPTERQTVARARLLLRSGEQRRVAARRFIMNNPITCLEYQAFLDSLPPGQERTPDHWVELLFPPGQQDLPVIGIRYEDAVAFCAWLSELPGTSGSIMLPAAAELLGENPDALHTRCWTNSSVELDGPMWSRLVRTRNQIRTGALCPVGSDLIDHSQRIASRLHDDLRLLSVPTPSADGLRWLDFTLQPRLPVYELGVLAPASRTPAELEPWVITRLKERSTSYVSGGALTNAEQVLLLTKESARSIWRLPIDAAVTWKSLAELGQALYDAAKECFRRDRCEDPRSERLRAQRAALRGYALGMSTIAEHLKQVLDPTGNSDPLKVRKNLNIANRADANLVGLIAASLLADVTLDCYLNLVLSELTLDGEVAPMESLLPVRSYADREASSVGPSPTEPAGYPAKAFADRVMASLLLLVLSPLMLTICLTIPFSSRGPVFFMQKRVGLQGRVFRVVKFRTMVPEQDWPPLREMMHNGAGPLFKIRRDPRVTRIGGWLRRWSLDELPQLFNVLLGDMSMVGPRPPLVEDTTRYGPDEARRLLVKPGLTGLWQVSGRSDLSWDESIRLDLAYVENWSWRVDLSILAKTLRSIFRGDGAY